MFDFCIRLFCPRPLPRPPPPSSVASAEPEGEGPSEPTVRERTERFRVRSVDRAPWDWPRHMPRHGLPRVPFPFACRPVSGPSGAARAHSARARAQQPGPQSHGAPVECLEKM